MPKATITLDRNNLSQIIEALTQRMESYTHTAEFLDDENHNLEGYLIKEMCNSTEARNVVRYFKNISDEITQQLKATA